MPHLAADEFVVGPVQIPSVRTPSGQSQKQTLQFHNLTYPHRSPARRRRTIGLRMQLTTTIAVIESFRLDAQIGNELAFAAWPISKLQR
jgi:hypothetical protein